MTDKDHASNVADNVMVQSLDVSAVGGDKSNTASGDFSVDRQLTSKQSKFVVIMASRINISCSGCT